VAAGSRPLTPIIDATKLTEGVTTFLEDTVGLSISHVDAIITAEAAEPKVALALQIAEKQPVLSMYTVIRDTNAVAIAMGRIVFEPNRLRLSVGADGEWSRGRAGGRRRSQTETSRPPS
jgi:DNA-binding GntR family transcriptional regulator